VEANVIVEGKTVLVTGSNQGIGLGILKQLLKRKVGKIYATDLRLENLSELAGLSQAVVVPAVLDVTSAESVHAAARRFKDVDVLINNAGVNSLKGLLDDGGMEAVRRDIEVNCFGMLSMCREFIPLMKRRGGGAIVNMVSSLVYDMIPAIGSYSASKAASHQVSELLRLEVRNFNIQLLAAYPGAIDTPMLKDLDIPKISVSLAAGNIIDALESNRDTVLVGEEGIEAYRRFRERVIVSPQ
jgi:NAD(P)-dependent dehydrogenase (short-subunit alcohol dehydrogenase family)